MQKLAPPRGCANLHIPPSVVLHARTVTIMKKILKKIGIILICFGLAMVWVLKVFNSNPIKSIGDSIDSFNNVPVYYNGSFNNNFGRNITSDNYNLGLKYQCVEFVKRYYYKHLNHRMPDTYGHAKDFFDSELKDSQINKKRNLIQYTNPSIKKPQIDDIVIFSSTKFNKFGHVAIITKVGKRRIEIIQQNSGLFGRSRIKLPLEFSDGKWEIKNSRVMGRLRK